MQANCLSSVFKGLKSAAIDPRRRRQRNKQALQFVSLTMRSTTKVTLEKRIVFRRKENPSATPITEPALLDFLRSVTSFA